MKTTETFINAQLLSDRKFYNKIEIKYNSSTLMYTLFADGVFKAESYCFDTLISMVGVVLRNRKLFIITNEINKDFDVIRYNIEEVPLELITARQTLEYVHNGECIIRRVTDIGESVFTHEQDARNKVIEMCREDITDYEQRVDRLHEAIDSLTKCLQYYEG